MIKINTHNGHFLIKPDRVIKKEMEPILSKRWDMIGKQYVVPASPHTAKLIEQALGDKLQTNENFIWINSKNDVSLDALRCGDEWCLKTTPWRHQEIGILWALKHKASMLAMEMGPLSGDTEYLSPDGWRRIDRYDGGLVAQYNIHSQSSNFTQPTDYIKKPSEQMIHIKTRFGVDQMISEEHTMLVVDTKGSLKRLKAIDFYNDNKRLKYGTKLKIPTTFISNLGGGIDLSEYEIRLMVAFIADGSIVKSSAEKGKISVSKERKKRRIEFLLKKCHIDFKIHKDAGSCKCFYFRPPILTKSFKQFWKCSFEQMRIIADECLNWDGQRRSDNLPNYFYSSEKESADFIQYCFSGIGYPASITVRSKRSHKTEYIVNVRKNSRHKAIGIGGKNSHNNISIVPNEDGWKYCFSVPDGFLVLRRNNCIFISGNTGKSLCAVAVAGETQAKRTLIICPKSVVNVWPKQFRIHSNLEWNVVPLAKGSIAKRARQLEQQLDISQTKGEPLVAVLNYDSCWREPLKTALLKSQWDLLILDESQRIKGSRGKGSASRFIGIELYDIPRKIALSGYPMPHSPMDLFGQFRALDVGIFGSYYGKFESRYAVKGGYGGYQVISYQNMDEFTDRFNMLAYQVKKEEALELPPEVDEMIPVELDAACMKIYKKLEKDFYVDLEEGEMTAANAMVVLLRLQQITSGFGRTESGEDVFVSSCKIDALHDILDDCAKPVVVFCRFKNDLREVRKLADRTGLRMGEVSGSRNDLTDEATMPENIDLLCVQIQSGGVGIDLSRSSLAVYFSLGYSLGDYLQSRSRLHRPGQKNKVTFIHLLAKDTVDEKVYNALMARKEVIDFIMKSKNTLTSA